jgi:hypothetical protein
MKPSNAESSPDDAPAVAPVPAGLCLAAGVLLSWLPLLFTRGVQDGFSGAASVWSYSLGFVMLAGSLGLMLGIVVGRRWGLMPQRWLQTLFLLGAFATLPLLPERDAIAVAPVDAAAALLKWLLVKAGATSLALGAFLGIRLVEERSEGRGLAALIGLLAGQVAFLFLLDPLLPTSRLDVAFSWSVLSFAIVAILWLWRAKPLASANSGKPAAGPGGSSPFWVGLIEAGLHGAIAALLIVVTARVMFDSVSVPRFWVLPCLITLVAAAAGRSRGVFHHAGVILGLAVVGWAALTLALQQGAGWEMARLVPVLNLGLAASVLACAGALGLLHQAHPAESVRVAPWLGVMIAAPLVTHVAQRFTTAATEFPVTLSVAAVLVMLVLFKAGRVRLINWIGVIGLVALGYALVTSFQQRDRGAIGRVRTFFGVTATIRAGAGADAYHSMWVGDSLRAVQFLDEEGKIEPTLYHGRNTGIGNLFRTFPKGNFRNVGVIGIGNGDLVAYATPSDSFRFYEYDPGAVLTAERQFGYLKHADFDWEIVPGDPRLALERADPMQFDILIIDALSAGTLPVHLVTSEAFALWKRHLAPDGLLAVNITNRRFDLVPVVWRLAIEHGWLMAPALTAGDAAAGVAPAEWLFLTDRREILTRGSFMVPKADETAQAREFPLWTDEDRRPLAVLR